MSFRKPKVAVLSFPGNNCEVEAIRAIKRADLEPVYCRWNGGVDQFAEIDAYFIPGGFSYEDRGRAGMVAARDPILAHVAEEAAAGKPVVGVCNGAQVLVETGLIPLGKDLSMSLARNAVDGRGVGFLNEWIYITASGGKDRCCTSNWDGAIHIPIAHGEGRFTTADADLFTELQEANQLAFQYCDADGVVSQDPIVTPNGSEFAVAGICNPEGNVVALMPHPERTTNGDPFFTSLRLWIESHTPVQTSVTPSEDATGQPLSSRAPTGLEIFIDTKIVNNEERTVQQAARRTASTSTLTLKQLQYISAPQKDPADILRRISIFNPNKEIAYIRTTEGFFQWNPDAKTLEEHESILDPTKTLLRRDKPDTGAAAIGEGVETGVCYVCSNVEQSELQKRALQEVFANTHSSTLEVLC